MGPGRTRVLIALVTAAAVVGAVRPAGGSCAPPTVDTNAHTYEMGDPLVVRGIGWVSGCDDTPDDDGCSGDEVRPVGRITIQLRGPVAGPDGKQPRSKGLPTKEITLRLGAIEADEDARFRFETDVPDVAPGYFVLTAIAAGLHADQPPEILIRR